MGKKPRLGETPGFQDTVWKFSTISAMKIPWDTKNSFPSHQKSIVLSRASVPMEGFHDINAWLLILTFWRSPYANSRR